MNSQETQGPAGAPQKSSVTPLRSHHYLPVLVISLVVICALLVGIYIFGLNAVIKNQRASRNATSTDSAVTSSDEGRLNQVEANLNAMDVEHSDAAISSY